MSKNIIQMIALVCVTLIAIGEIIIIISLAKSNTNKKLVAKINIILVAIFVLISFVNALILIYLT